MSHGIYWQNAVLYCRIYLMMTGSSSTKSTSLYQVNMLICLPETIPSIFMNGNPTFLWYWVAQVTGDGLIDFHILEVLWSSMYPCEVSVVPETTTAVFLNENLKVQLSPCLKFNLWCHCDRQIIPFTWYPQHVMYLRVGGLLDVRIVI